MKLRCRACGRWVAEGWTFVVHWLAPFNSEGRYHEALLYPGLPCGPVVAV